MNPNLNEHGIDRRASAVAEFLTTDATMARNIAKGNWVSGSSTVVSPVSIWAATASKPTEIVVQLKDYRASLHTFRGVVGRLLKAFPDIVSHFCVSNYDGSCPRTFHVYIGESR